MATKLKPPEIEQHLRETGHAALIPWAANLIELTGNGFAQMSEHLEELEKRSRILATALVLALKPERNQEEETVLASILQTLQHVLTEPEP